MSDNSPKPNAEMMRCRELEEEVRKLKEELRVAHNTIVQLEEANRMLQRVRQPSGERSSASSDTIFDEAGAITVDMPKDILGEGAFGQVLLGRFENDRCAVKRQPVRKDRRISDIRNEIRTIRSRCNHQNVIRYYCSQKHMLDDMMFVDIAMELCDTDLNKYINADSRDTSLEANIDLLTQCAKGIEYLHTLTPMIIHRDIKPANILISFTGESLPPRIVITDFGLSRELDHGNQAQLSSKVGGTFGWKAPELLSDDGHVKFYSNKIDIFSLGCLFYFVLTAGKHPFHNNRTEFPPAIDVKILSNNFDIQLDDPIAVQLIRLMIHQDPDDRIDVECVRKHPFFYNTDGCLEYLKKIFDKFDSKAFSGHIRQSLDWHFDRLDWREDISRPVRDNFRRTKAGKTYDIYNPTVLDLLKAIRNKYVHFNETRNELDDFGSSFQTYWDYWRSRFALLIPLVYEIIAFDHDKDVDYFRQIYGYKNAKIIAKNFWMKSPIHETITQTKLLKTGGTANVLHASWKVKSNQLFTAADDKILTFWTLTVRE